MKQTNKENGTVLEAAEGKDLVIIVDGLELNRTKEVFIPLDGTINTWTEVDSVDPDILEQEIARKQRIADLLAELESLTSN